MVVAITGSVGKTSTKEAIFAVLREKFSARRSEGNFNTEIGVPLTIIGVRHWLWAIIKAAFLFFLPLRYPKVLVLEMAADRPGDIAYLTSFVKPTVGVVTAVGPSHLEFFGTLKKIAEEKSNVVKALSSAGIAVLNYDDEEVRAMAGKNRGRTIYYSFIANFGAQSRGHEIASSPEASRNDIVEAVNITYSAQGTSFKIQYQGNTVPVRLPGSVGKPNVYAALAAAGVGLALGMNLLEISRGLLNYKNLPGRLRLLPGVKNTQVIDDTYNAAPASAVAALEILSKIEGKRKIAVLGDMAELGEYTEDGHRQVGAEVVQQGIGLLVTVGPKAKFIADQAIHMGYPDKQIMRFEDAAGAQKPVEKLLQPGDVILVKGSRMMRMEKIVREIMAEPEKAEELLVS